MPAWLTWKKLRVLGTVAPVLLLASMFLFAVPLDPWSYRPLWWSGSIYVSGPQIYTRERLVNDRYREDAWLLGELNRSAQIKFVTPAVLSTEHSQRVTATAGSGNSSEPVASNSAKDAASQLAPSPQPANDDKLLQPSTTKDNPLVELTPFQRFEMLQVYREQIRDLMIENQLDDRHDLRGNSLYRLRFDAAVLPGSRQENAKITVSVLPPKGLLGDVVDKNSSNVRNTRTSESISLSEQVRDVEKSLTKLQSVNELEKSGIDRNVWERMYVRWLDSMEKRFAANLNDVKNAFEYNRFSPEDYDLLITTIEGQIVAWWVSVQQEKPKWEQYVRGLSSEDRQLLEAMKRSDQQLLKPSKHLVSESKCRDPEVRRALVRSDDKQEQDFHRSCKALVDRLLLTALREAGLVSLLEGKAQAEGRKDTPEAGFNERTKLPSPNKETGDQNTTQNVQLQALSGKRSSMTEQKSDNEATGCYVYMGYSATPENTFDPSTPPPKYNLNDFIEGAFEAKLYKAVVGLDASEISSTDDSPLSAGQRKLMYLNQLASVKFLRDKSGKPTITFRRITGQIHLADDERCFEGASDILRHKSLLYLESEQLKVRNLLSDYDPKPDVEAVAQKWRRLEAGGHVETITVDIGLINFIRSAGRQLDIFSYALPPSEPDELTAVKNIESLKIALDTESHPAVVKTILAAFEDNRNKERQSIDANKSIVGFGEQPNVATAKFGWVFFPHKLASGAFESKQKSLTALISLPAWWEEMRLEVQPAWTDLSENGDRAIGAPAVYTVELPVNFETVDASLFETNDRSPAVNEWEMKRTSVTACEDADILIPGLRLWRSTVVTLGGQRADQISVLPNMNGIVASFRPVKIRHLPSEGSSREAKSGSANGDRDIFVPLTVWTSEGSTTLFHWIPVHDPSTNLSDDRYRECLSAIP